MSIRVKFCDCSRALKTPDEYARGQCNKCREDAAADALADLTDDGEEDELADLTLPICSYCHTQLTEDDDAYCSNECASLARLQIA